MDPAALVHSSGTVLVGLVFIAVLVAATLLLTGWNADQ
jgi:hypothetical protein